MAKKKKQILASVDLDLAKAFQRKLISQELSYREWLESEMRKYLGRKPSPSKTRRK